MLLMAQPAHAQGQQLGACPAQAPVKGDANFTYLTETQPDGPDFFDRTGCFDGVTVATNPLVVPQPGLQNAFEVFCVDFADDLNPVTNYDVDLTALTSTASYANTKIKSEQQYWEAAFIVTNYFQAGNNPAVNSSADWQWAIWGITDDGGSCVGLGSGCNGDAQTLESLAESAWNNIGTDGYTTDSFSTFAIITDAGASCSGAPSSSPTGICQELLYNTVPNSQVTPEPGTMSLIALGLAGMAGAGMRRRKRR